MIRTLISLATLSLVLADGPIFTVQPKGQPDMCIDNKPLSGSDRSYASLQKCAFNQDGTPIATQSFQFDNQSPLAEHPASERLYGFYPNGARGCFAEYIPGDDNVFSDHHPPGVTECSTAEDDKVGANWWFDDWEKEGLKFRKAKLGRYGLSKSLELRPENRTGHGENPTPIVWKLRTAPGQFWSVRLYPNSKL